MHLSTSVEGSWSARSHLPAARASLDVELAVWRVTPAISLRISSMASMMSVGRGIGDDSAIRTLAAPRPRSARGEPDAWQRKVAKLPIETTLLSQGGSDMADGLRLGQIGAAVKGTWSTATSRGAGGAVDKWGAAVEIGVGAYL
jgi:hypothetical protein